MKIYVDKMPVQVRQRVIHYDDGKTNCVELEFAENVKPTEICDTQSLKQQVREDVVGEIKEKIKNIKENILTYYRGNQDICNGIINDMDYGQIYGLNKLLKILDKVKGEDDEQKR